MSKQQRPNILLFLTDDHAPWSIGCYGNREARTPRLDRLAEGGTRFDNAFTPCPVCSPARACLMTGRTPSQVGIHDWLDERDAGISAHGWLADEVTLPTLVHQAGYWTALAGKWHLGGSDATPPGFDRCFGLPGGQGQHNGDHRYHLDGEPLPLSGNKTTHITDHALTFLNEAPADQPFFLNVGYIATHSPYVADAHDPDRVAAMSDLTFTDIPPYEPHPWHRNEGFAGDERSPDPQELRRRYLGYYAAVAEIDHHVGRILDHLGDRRLSDNTLVVYVSDHGAALGHHGFWGKGNSTRPLNMYDTSLRVPLIVRGPGVKAGGVESRCVDHYDLFRAVLEWAGVDLTTDRPPPGSPGHSGSPDYPGQSLVSLAAGRDAAWDDTRFGEYGDLRMIRTPRLKFVKRYPAGPYDLFDLERDPGETRNVAGWASYAERQRELETRLEDWYAGHEVAAKSGLRVKSLPRHNTSSEAWRDGIRESRGLQAY